MKISVLKKIQKQKSYPQLSTLKRKNAVLEKHTHTDDMTHHDSRSQRTIPQVAFFENLASKVCPFDKTTYTLSHVFFFSLSLHIRFELKYNPQTQRGVTVRCAKVQPEREREKAHDWLYSTLGLIIISSSQSCSATAIGVLSSGFLFDALVELFV